MGVVLVVLAKFVKVPPGFTSCLWLDTNNSIWILHTNVRKPPLNTKSALTVVTVIFIYIGRKSEVTTWPVILRPHTKLPTSQGPSRPGTGCHGAQENPP